MRACFALVFLAACGGSVSTTPDASRVSDSAVATHDAGDPMLDTDSGTDDAADDSPPGMPTPPGSILALARGPNQNDYLTIVRIVFPSATVTPLFTFQPPNGMHARSIAMRPDGALDRFDVEGGNTPKTHAIAISKQTGALLGQERVFDGVITGADWSNDTLWATVAHPQQPTLVVSIDSNNTLTPIAKGFCLRDVGILGPTVAVLAKGCGEDAWWDDILAFTNTGMPLKPIAFNIAWWDAMTPMGAFLVALDDSGALQVFDPSTQLWSARVKTAWHFEDATEDF